MSILKTKKKYIHENITYAYINTQTLLRHQGFPGRTPDETGLWFQASDLESFEPRNKVDYYYQADVSVVKVNIVKWKLEVAKRRWKLVK